MDTLKKFSSMEKINKGMSADEKYKVTSAAGEVFLLRLSALDTFRDKEQEFKRMEAFERNGIPVPMPVSFGITEDGKKVYSLTAWLNGALLETALHSKTREEQYALGRASGEILEKVHSLGDVTMAQSWYERYFEVITPRIEAYQKDDIHFQGDTEILRYIEDKKELLRARPQVMLHGDYHMGNMILSADNKISVIDWEKVDFDNIGDPWYEFNRIGTEFPAFANGQIDGYFHGNVPREFWELLAFYLSAGAITSVVWAKYCAGERLNEILSLNKKVLVWFDNMKNPIPCW